MIKTQKSLDDRFVKATTIPGTRSYHEFIPISENTIAMKYWSKDQVVATTFSFSNKDKVSDTVNSNEESSENVKALDLFSSYYNNYWWIGLVKKKIALKKMNSKKISILNSCIPCSKSIICVAFFQGYLLSTKQPYFV